MIYALQGWGVISALGYLWQMLQKKSKEIPTSPFFQSPRRKRLGVWGKPSSQGQPSTREHGPGEALQLGFSTSLMVWLWWLGSEAHLCSREKAPSGSREMDGEKQEYNLCHIFLSPLITARMQISHSFSKWLHKHHINFVHISPKKSVSC